MKARHAVKRTHPYARISLTVVTAAVCVAAGVIMGTAGNTIALFSDREDTPTEIVAAGELHIELDDVYTWEMKVSADDSIVGDDYAEGETVRGSSDKDDLSELLMGGDWTDLTITRTGIATLSGGNLVAAVTVILGEATGVLGSDLSYRLSVDGTLAGTFDGTVSTYVGPEIADGTHTISLSVTVNGSAFGITPQVLTAPPDALGFSQPFDIRLVQVRVP